MLASVARYYNFDEITRHFIAEHETCNIINLGAGLETAAFRLQADSTIFYEIDLPEVIEQRTFYTAARKMLKRKLKPYTRIAMKVGDDGGRTIILHLKLN